MIQLRAKGISRGLNKRTYGRISFSPVPENDRQNVFRVMPNINAGEDLKGYLAALFAEEMPENLECPSVSGFGSFDFLKDGYVIAIDPSTGFTRVLYRTDSRFNTIFATDNCNNNCLMCSQPPKKVDESDIIEGHLRQIELISDKPERLCITGGEPTLLGNGLVQVLSKINMHFPDISLLMLSNGRMLSYADLAKKIASAAPRDFTVAIPLYSSDAHLHDYVVQSRGAFDQTILGLYNLAREGVKVEIRVVLHKQTVGGLLDLVDYIYRNLSFVSHVALMGLENMGYVKKNWDSLWVDPLDYSDDLEKAVRFLWYRQMNVSVYNLPLCIIPKSLWSFARQSISDYKNIYLETCDSCSARHSCSGLFQSGETRHSRGIKAIKV